MEKWLLNGHSYEDPCCNDLSCILMIDFNGASLFVAGDSSVNVIEKALYNASQCNILEKNKITVYRIAHHGSKGSSSATLWREWMNDKCNVLISSSGSDARYGLPHIDTLKHISKECPEASIFCTNQCLHSQCPVSLEDDLVTDRLESLGSKCHGDCIVRICDDKIAVDTERMPDCRCPC